MELKKNWELPPKHGLSKLQCLQSNSRYLSSLIDLSDLCFPRNNRGEREGGGLGASYRTYSFTVILILGLLFM